MELKNKNTKNKNAENVKLRIFRRAKELDELIPVPENPRDEAQRQLYYERSRQYGSKRSAYMEVIRDLGLFKEYVEWDALNEPSTDETIIA